MTTIPTVNRMQVLNESIKSPHRWDLGPVFSSSYSILWAEYSPIHYNGCFSIIIQFDFSLEHVFFSRTICLLFQFLVLLIPGSTTKTSSCFQSNYASFFAGEDCQPSLSQISCRMTTSSLGPFPETETCSGTWNKSAENCISHSGGHFLAAILSSVTMQQSPTLLPVMSPECRQRPDGKTRCAVHADLEEGGGSVSWTHVDEIQFFPAHYSGGIDLERTACGPPAWTRC